MYIPNTQNKSSIDLLDFIQERATIGTWEYNPTSTILNWSIQTKKIHEVPLDYVPNVEIGISFYKEGYSRDTITRLFTNCIENHEDFDIEVQIITHTGKDKWVRAIGIAIVKNDTCILVQGLFQDIDKSTKDSKNLAFKELQLRRTFETALVGMAIVDLEGNWIDVNKSLCNTFGYSKEEIEKLSFMDITHPDDLRKDYKAMMSMMSGKIDHYETEKRYISKQHETIWTQLSTSIVRDDKGQPQHFVAQINDVTEIKKASKKVSQLLTTTEDQNKRLLNFAQIVSHNLRSHYGNLDMLLDIVKMDLPETTDNEIFPLICLAVSHLGETVENLNEVAAINIQKDLKTEPLNLLENFNRAYSSISALIIDSKTTISINIEPHIVVKAVPAYLDSILLNFLTNAIKYKKPAEPAKIEISTSIKDNFVVLEIKDYGQGIDLIKYGEKLFGMYKTFHKHEDSRGLGLFITKNQVEAIGGKIEVESEVNEGTTFYIHLKTHE
ncbi:histidine kinase-response regulator hybrid protein [Winogradskyella psychrotolerans RS-3]|uniref:histidine kinase n=1 Tax=Winogradskyella psychrotolerans RS-3 TaxID=641526 RepID=S7VVP5_9FLAO|nr:HAMP domain-containing sensor histidine kinase [Winogradskyella psychrotolerans]EPR74161.1 histidine kinase-response regulator hybrid protein [Winogradskyella psychrotolerans RS-3]